MSTSEPPKPEEPGAESVEPKAVSPAQPAATGAEPVAEPAPPTPPAGRGRRWRPTGRSGLVLGGLAVLLVGLVIGGGVGFAAGHHGGGHRGGGPGFQHGMGQHHGMGSMGHPGIPGGPGRGGAQSWGPGGPEGGGPGMGFGERGMAGSSALIGTVSSVNGTSLAVTEDGAGPVTVTTSDRTRVLGEQRTAVTDLKQGDRVLVRVGPDHTALGVRALAASARGTVTALNGTSATLTSPDGLVRALDTSALTTQPKVGDLVAVRGAAADNGATIKAQTLRTLPKTN